MFWATGAGDAVARARPTEERGEGRAPRQGERAFQERAATEGHTKLCIFLDGLGHGTVSPLVGDCGTGNDDEARAIPGRHTLHDTPPTLSAY